MNVLFICNQNKHRSKTAELIFKNKFKTKSAGLFNNHPLRKSELEWADIVAVMEDRQRKEIADRFPREYLSKKIISLDIPDIFSFNQEELKEILESKSSLF